jgi:hypothetical protein
MSDTESQPLLIENETETTLFDANDQQKGTWQELKTLGSLAWPVSLTNLLQFSITSTSYYSVTLVYFLLDISEQNIWLLPLLR